MSTQPKRLDTIGGVILAVFFMYVAIHTGGNSQFFGYASALGCILGTARAIQVSRREQRVPERQALWLSAAIGAWVATSLTGLFIGGPMLAAEALGTSLVMGSGMAWGFACVASEAVRALVVSETPKAEA